MSRRMRIVLSVALGLVLALMALALRPLLVELQVKRHLAAAQEVTIIIADPILDASPVRQWRLRDTQAVSYLAHILLDRETRRSDPHHDKCFEGWETHHAGGKWPRVIFNCGRGRYETIYLPLGDCQVWSDHLPWGWAWSGSTFANAIGRLTSGSPSGEAAENLSNLARRGWELMPPIDYAADAWLPPQGVDPSRYHPGYVEGDFNGDRHTDWAAQLRAKGGSTIRLLIGHGPPERATTFEIRSGSYRDGLQGGYDGYTFYLRLRQPGLITYWTGSGPTGRLDLKHDGVEMIFAGKTSSLYHWDGTRYASVTTSD